jgi:hypothetical protein
MDSHISDRNYYFSGKNIIRDHRAIAVNLGVSIHLFPTVDITFAARTL